MKQISLAIIFLSCLLYSSLSFGQATDISDPNVAALPEVNRCDGNTTVMVDFVWGTTGTAALITAAMPTGFTYVAGTVSGTGFSESDVSDLSIPIFAFTGPVASAMNTISFDVTANCDGVDGTPSIPISVDIDGAGTAGAGGGTGNISVRLVSAALSFSSTHATQTVVPGDEGCVDVVISNGGLGSLDTLVFSITENGTAETQSIMIGALTLMGSGPYTLGEAELLAAGVGTSFENGESITITRCYEITGCTGDLPNTWTDNYIVNYGCPGECQIDGSTNGSFFIPAGGPNISISTAIIQQSNKCDDLIREYTYTNVGTGDASVSDAFSIIPRFNGSSNIGNVWTTDHFDITTAQVSDGMGGFITAPFTGGTTTFASVQLSALTADPDGTGGLEDLDGDGEFDDLAVGESFTIRYTLEYLCNLVCDQPGNRAFISYANLANVCGGRSNYGRNQTNDAGPGNVSSSVIALPVTMSEGQSSTIEICFDINNPDSDFSCPTNEYELTFNYDEPFVTIDQVRLNGAANSFTDNAEVSFTTLLNASQTEVQCLQIEFTVDAGICPSAGLEFNYELNHTCDATCADCTSEPRTCGDISIAIDCPGVCTEGGLFTTSVTMSRTTFGFTDETGATTVDPSTLPLISLKRAQPCDSVEVCASGTQALGTIITTGSTAYVAISYDQFAAANAFEWVGGATASITPAAGTGVTDIAIGAPIYEATVAGQHVVYYDLSAALTAYGSDLTQDDEVAIKFQGIVQNENFVEGVEQVANFSLNFFNLDPADTTPDPETDTQYFCNSQGIEFYLRRTNPTIGDLFESIEACNIFSLNNSDRNSLQPRTSGALDIDYFPGEVRPTFVLDSIVVRIPNYLSYQNSGTVRIGSGSDGNYPAFQALTTPDSEYVTSTDTFYTFINDGSWPLPDEARNGRSGLIYHPYFDVKPNCLLNVNIDLNNSYNITYHGKRNVNSADPDCPTLFSRSESVTLSGRIGESRITNLTGTVVGDEAVECFNIQVEEFRGRAGTAATLAFPTAALGATLVSVTEGGTPFTLLPYADGQYIELDSDVTANEIHNLEVCIAYSDCEKSEVPILIYSDCEGFVDPLTTICPVGTDTLKIEPVAVGEVQLDFIRQPPSVIDLCQAYTYEVRLNSAQAASILDPSVEFTLPTGLTLVDTTAEVTYPSNAAAAEMLTLTSAGSTYSIDLTDHTAIAANSNSIDGVGAAATNEDRQVIITFDVITDCNFVTGGIIPFTVNADQPCGDPAIGAGNAINSSPLTVTNSNITYNTAVSIMSSPVFMCPSDQLTIPVRFTVTDKSDAGMMSTTLDSDDQVQVTLSAGLDYVDGSLSTTDGLTFVSETVDGSGNTVIVFALPSATIPNQGMVTYDFEIDAALSAAADCGDMFVSAATITSLISGQPCATEMSGTCPGNTTVSTGTTTNSLSVQYPTVSNLAVTTTATTTVGQYDVNGTFDLSDAPLPAGEALILEIFCVDGNGDALTSAEATISIAGPLAIGTAIPISASNLALSCDPAFGAVYSFTRDQDMDGTGEQCLCSDVLVTQNTALPVELLYFKGTYLERGAVELSWATETELDADYFQIERMLPGTKDFEPVMKVQAVGSSLVFRQYLAYDEDIKKAGLYYYRLKMVDVDGSYEYSQVIAVIISNGKINTYEVSPNPATDLLTINITGAWMGAATLELRDIKGTTVLSTIIEKRNSLHSEVLNVDQLEAGMYYLNIQHEGKVVIRKVIVQ